MAINIKMTPVHHDARLELGLDLIEYTVAHIIYFSSANPKAPVPGWCSYSKRTIGEFVGVSERKVFSIIDKLEGALLVERHETQGFARTTALWFEMTMTDSAKRAGGMQNLQGDPAEFAEGGMQDLQTLSNTVNNSNKNPLTPKGEQGALFGLGENPQQGEAPKEEKNSELYRRLVDMVNAATGQKRKGTAKGPAKLAARLKQGWTMDDLERAVQNAAANEFHRSKNFHHLTPDFFTREDKLDYWANASTGPAKPKELKRYRDMSPEEQAIYRRQNGMV